MIWLIQKQDFFKPQTSCAKLLIYLSPQNHANIQQKILPINNLFFVIEVLIALYVHDTIIRPYFGDVNEVVILDLLFYVFLKLPVLPVKLHYFVLLFSFSVEFLQYLNIIEKLGLQNSKIARTVIGTSFAWIDLVCYIAGIIIVIIAEEDSRKTADNIIVTNKK